jgi:hypothetical protein
LFSIAAALDAATASAVFALSIAFSSAIVFPVSGLIKVFKSIPALANL